LLWLGYVVAAPFSLEENGHEGAAFPIDPQEKRSSFLENRVRHFWYPKSESQRTRRKRENTEEFVFPWEPVLG
jgi:hypothetical protein